MEAIRQRIATRSLVPGDRLPSIRQFARTMQASPSTVVQAYDRLAARVLLHRVWGQVFMLRGAHFRRYRWQKRPLLLLGPLIRSGYRANPLILTQAF